ncbi:MAG: helix-hairpin-helix domain-containing protein [Alistipes sp.]|nr:helix-hairpin-helix domain-containing protein [Alistipes sp.]
MSKIRRIITGVGGKFRLSRAEGRGILILLPLLAVAGILLNGLGRPKPDPAFLERADSIISGGRDANVPGYIPAPDSLFRFDPNTVTHGELCALGFDQRTANSIIRYREAGKVFREPSDLATCYGVTPELYIALEPYIVIGERFADRPSGRSGVATKVRADMPFDPNALDATGFEALGFTPAQARTIVNYRKALGRFVSAEQFGKCYAVSDEALGALGPYMRFPPDGQTELAPDGTVAANFPENPYPENGSSRIKSEQAPDSIFPAHPSREVPYATYGTENAPFRPVELNTADSTALRSVHGIGEVLVERIMEYRRRLGGFHSAEQLAEVRGMTPANYERICEQITVDSCVISKIDINFAPHKELVEALSDHPYAHGQMVRKLLSERQLEGGWSTTRELVDDKIMTESEARKLAPYLLFRQPENER